MCLVGNGAPAGGSLYVEDFSSATIVDCTFSKNVPGRIGGAIRVCENSSLVLTGTTFSGNALTLPHKTFVIFKQALKRA